MLSRRFAGSRCFRLGFSEWSLFLGVWCLGCGFFGCEKASEALDESEARFTFLFESAIVAVAVANIIGFEAARGAQTSSSLGWVVLVC